MTRKFPESIKSSSHGRANRSVAPYRSASQNLRPKLFFWQAKILLSPHRLFKVLAPYLPQEKPSPNFGLRKSANSHDSPSDSANALRGASPVARHSARLRTHGFSRQIRLEKAS